MDMLRFFDNTEFGNGTKPWPEPIANNVYIRFNDGHDINYTYSQSYQKLNS